MKHAISLELKNHKGDNNFDSLAAESGFLKVKNEPMDCSDDFNMKEKSNDSSYWDNWASTNFGITSGCAQSTISDTSNQMMNATSVYSNSTGTSLSEVTSPIGSDIHSPLSGQQSPITPTNQTSWTQGRMLQTTMQPNERQGMLSPVEQHCPIMTNNQHVPAWPNDPHIPMTPNGTHIGVNNRQLGSVRADMSPGTVLNKPPFGQVQGPRLMIPERAPVPNSQHQSDISGKSRTFSAPSVTGAPSPNVSKAGTFETSPLTKIPILETKTVQHDYEDEKLKAVNDLLGKNKNMDDFISKIVEAGKCLQLLNYRVSLESLTNFT